MIRINFKSNHIGIETKEAMILVIEPFFFKSNHIGIETQ